MDIRQLQAFVSVAREGSFTGAATKLYLVQSAVSASVAALEADLGERLFHRTTRRVQLTAAGRVLLQHATSILDAVQAARDAVEGVSGGLSGSIRIGYMTNVTLFDIPRLLGRFKDDHPDVTMHLAASATGTAGLIQGVRRGDLDLAFTAADPEDYPDLRIDVLARTPLGLAMAISDPLADRRPVKLADTAALRFVDLPAGFATRTLVDAEFRRRGLHRDVQIETSDLTDAAALVRNGLGAGFLPHYLVAGDSFVQWAEIEDATLEMCVSIATAPGRELSAAASRLATLAWEDARSG